MKIYAGVLYSGENEFDACIESIEAQDYTNYEYFVFKGLTYKEAHDALFTHFLETGFDVLVKIDADMVLLGDDLFSFIRDSLVENMRINHLQFPVYDFFSNQPIWGLNVYRGIDFNKTDDQVFTDIIEVDNRAMTLKIAATHCQDPNLFQSFHYGAHKAIKIFEAKKKGMGKRIEYYKDILNKTYQSYLKTGDERRAACISGARLAAAKGMGAEYLNYGNHQFLNYFNQIQDHQGKENLCL